MANIAAPPFNFVAGTNAIADNVDSNFDHFVTHINGKNIDSTQIETLTAALAWNVSSAVLAIDIDSSGTAGCIDVTQTGVLGVGKTVATFAATTASNVNSGADEAVVFIESTIAASQIPALLIKDDGAAATNRKPAIVVDSTTKGVQMPRMTTAQREAINTPLEGEEIYNTTLKRKEVYDGTYWRAPNSGEVVWLPMDSITTRPDVVECDGTTLANAAPNIYLITILGSTYGGPRVLPTQARHGLMGKGGSAVNGPANTVGATGGSESHTLITAEVVSHKHTMAHTHGLAGSGAAANLNTTDHHHKMFANATGSDDPQADQQINFHRDDADPDPTNVNNYRMTRTTTAASLGKTSGVQSGFHTHTLTGNTAASSAADTGTTSAATGHANVQPSIVMNMCIVL